MHPREFISFMAIAEKLKCNTRHSWTSTGRHESVAEHTWRLSLMAYFVQDEFPEADISKVIQMCILHDLGEAVTGDIPSFLKTEENELFENSEVIKLIKTLPPFYQEKLLPLFVEMNEQQTIEAKLYKALDKLEAVMQHNNADISTWLPLEYELNISYGEENVQFSEYLKQLKKELNNDSLEKIKNTK
jgi:putative hydrolase of HD superfamily